MGKTGGGHKCDEGGQGGEGAVSTPILAPLREQACGSPEQRQEGARADGY